MRTIINRYLAREVLYSWLAVTLVLMFILLSNQFARVLGDAAAGKLPRDAVGSIIGLTSITYLTVLVPVSLFLAVMLALGRLYKDSEMSAISACGIGPMRIYRPIALVSVVVGLLLAWLSLFASPWAAAQAQRIVDTAKQQVGAGALEPGRFTTGGASGAVFYAEGVNAQGHLTNVFLQRRQGERVEVAIAESGEISEAGATGESLIVLRDGHRYEGIPGSLGFRIMHFAEHGIPLFSSQTGASGKVDREAMTTGQLLRSGAVADAAEFHWRLAAPISAMLLSLLAVPLARTNPRQGQYGKLAIGIGIYIIYANLLGAAQVWINQGRIPPLLGLWPVHLLFAMIAAALLWRQHHLPAPRRPKTA